MRIFLTIEKLLWSINEKSSAIRSPLPSWTGDREIDAFLGLTLCFESILPPAEPWKVSSHKVITASELLHICRDVGHLPECDVLGIAWMWPEDFASKEFDEYFQDLADQKPSHGFESIIMTGINKGPCKELMTRMHSHFIQSGKQVVFVNISRGALAFIDTKKLLTHLSTTLKNSCYYVYTKEVVPNSEIRSAPLGERFVPIEAIVQSVHNVCEKHGRNNLFIVASTDGYSKLFHSLSESPDRIKPIDNYLMDTVNSEFAQMKSISDLFLPGDSPFHTRQSIMYAGILQILISGLSAFPGIMMSLFGFADFAENSCLLPS
jgi:hypothetical protein